MVCGWLRVEPLDVTETSRTSAVVIDLAARRTSRDRIVAEQASAPIRFFPAALLVALEGSWGMPEELGLAPTPERHLRVVGG